MDHKPTFSHGYALIIGVGKDLPVTINDAKGLQEILCDAERGAYEADHVELLVEEKAQRKNILKGLDRLADYAANDPDATVIVFFSGHGGMFPDYHLVPWGYDQRNLSKTAISGGEFTNKLKRIKAKKLVVLLDCCHAGGMAEAKEMGFESAPLPPEIDSILTTGSGRVVIASCRKDELSYIGEPYSKFTQALREALAGYGAAERDGFSYIADIAIYVGRMVPNRSNDKQHPILKMARADNFAVGYYAGGSTTPKVLAQSEADLLPIDYLEAELVEHYRRDLRQYRTELLLIEERLARILYQQDISPELLERKRVVLQKIRETEVQIENLAGQSGWQPSRPQNVNVLALGKDSISVYADQGSRVTIRRRAPGTASENSSPPAPAPMPPTQNATNVIAGQDGAISMGAQDHSTIEIEEN